MTQRSVQYLKTRFETADIPTQSDYQDVFDSFLSLEASATQVLSGRIEGPAIAPTKLYHSNSTAVSAGPGTQAGATRLTNDQSYIFGNDVLGCGVVLATCDPGRIQILTNTNTTVLSVFPASGCNFIGTAENAPISLAKNGTMIVPHHTTSAYGVVRTQGV